MNEQQIKTLSSVVYTLGDIDVHGRENLDKMLGCIMTLEDMIKEARNADDKAEE